MENYESLVLTPEEEEELKKLENDPMVAIGLNTINQLYRKKQKLYKYRYYRKIGLKEMSKSKKEDK